MRRTLLAIAFSVTLPLSSAYADIASDYDAGLPASEILANATANGLAINDIMLQVAAADSNLLPAIVAAAIDAGLEASDVIAAAVAAGASPTSVVQAATDAGIAPLDAIHLVIAAGADRTEMLQLAISYDIDPTLVAEGTGAGAPTNPNPTDTTALPTGDTANIAPPAFGSNGGGGGGGNPSPI